MRESGLYWVKNEGGDWGIAYFDATTNSWLCIGTDESFEDEDFDIIGEQIKRES